MSESESKDSSPDVEPSASSAPLPDWTAAYLAHLSTNFHKLDAARAAGIDLVTVVRLRKANPDFAAQEREVMAAFAEVLEAEAIRRATTIPVRGDDGKIQRPIGSDGLLLRLMEHFIPGFTPHRKSTPPRNHTARAAAHTTAAPANFPPGSSISNPGPSAPPSPGPSAECNSQHTAPDTSKPAESPPFADAPIPARCSKSGRAAEIAGLKKEVERLTTHFNGARSARKHVEAQNQKLRADLVTVDGYRYQLLDRVFHLEAVLKACDIPIPPKRQLNHALPKAQFAAEVAAEIASLRAATAKPAAADSSNSKNPASCIPGRSPPV